jgi:hypothetical protein
MRSLRELQRDFGRSLLDPVNAGAMGTGFEIYVSNVYSNWTKALSAAYPIVCKIVGESFFSGLARAYARAHPSASGDLNEFGGHFADFIAQFPDTQDVPYLPDVARMEWHAHRAHFAAAAPAVDTARLTTAPPEELSEIRLHRSPASVLQSSTWPLARLWEVHQDNYRGGLDVDFESGGGQILIHRPRWRVEVESLASGDYRFLAEAGRGAALGDALEAASSADARFDATASLARWVNKGVVTL